MLQNTALLPFALEMPLHRNDRRWNDRMSPAKAFCRQMAKDKPRLSVVRLLRTDGSKTPGHGDSFGFGNTTGTKVEGTFHLFTLDKAQTYGENDMPKFNLLPLRIFFFRRKEGFARSTL